MKQPPLDIPERTRSMSTLALVAFARLHQEKMQQHLSPRVKARADRLEEAVTELEVACHARASISSWHRKARQRSEEAAQALDTALCTVSQELLGPRRLRKNRDAPAYRVLFPEGDVDVLDLPDRALLARVRGIIKHFDHHPEHPGAAHGTGLEERSAVLESTLAAVGESACALAAAQQAERAAREALRRALRKNASWLQHELRGQEAPVAALFPTSAQTPARPRDADEG